MDETPRPRGRAHAIRAAARSHVAVVLLFAATWWVLTGGASHSWLVGVPAIAAATWWSVCHAEGPGRLPRPFALARFAFYFLGESFRSGTYVAGLAVRPGARPTPHFVCFALSLPAGPARWTFLNTVSLLPGTLSAVIVGDALMVHRISTGPHEDADLRECEGRVARLYGLRVAGDGGVQRDA